MDMTVLYLHENSKEIAFHFSSSSEYAKHFPFLDLTMVFYFFPVQLLSCESIYSCKCVFLLGDNRR